MSTAQVSTQSSLVIFLPVALSAIAIFVSLATATFTAYIQYFKKPRVQMFVSRWVRCWKGANDELVFNLGLTATNSGAHYAVITKISGTLTSTSTSSSADFQWSKFVVYENAGAKGERFKPHGSFAGWADYLVIPNRQAVGNTIQFNTPLPFSVAPGRYQLQLYAYSGSGRKIRLVASAEVSFEVSDQKAEKLERTRVDPETQISNGAVGFSTIEESSGAA